LVDLFEYMMMHGLTNPKFIVGCCCCCYYEHWWRRDVIVIIATYATRSKVTESISLCYPFRAYP